MRSTRGAPVQCQGKTWHNTSPTCDSAICWKQVLKLAERRSLLGGLGFRVANLLSLKPDFEILAFFEHLWVFFSRKSLALEKHCLSYIFIKNLL